MLLHGGLNYLDTQQSHRAVREPGKDIESSESKYPQSTPDNFILTLCLGSNMTKDTNSRKTTPSPRPVMALSCSLPVEKEHVNVLKENKCIERLVEPEKHAGRHHGHCLP